MLESPRQNLSTPASADRARPAPNGGPRIVLFTEETGGDWHAARLKAALQARGFDVARTALSACAFDTGVPSGLAIPGFSGLLPDAAFVRAISAGTLEQITFRLGILHALSASGIRVWNPARVVERCVDKSTATFLFKRAGVPHPETHVVETNEHAREILARQPGVTLVAKPLFGSQGNGLVKVIKPGDLPASDALGGVYYLQEFVPRLSRPDGAFEDHRLLVSAGRVVAGMTRRSRDWIGNIGQGATATHLEPDEAMAELAVRAAVAVGADLAGVDIIRAEDGRLLVLEINSNPAWKGLQSVSNIDIADRLASDFAGATAADAR